MSRSCPDLITAFEVKGIRYLEIEAGVRIEVDSATGLLHRLVLDGRNATVDPGVPGIVGPPIDTVTLTTTFESLGDRVVIEAP